MSRKLLVFTVQLLSLTMAFADPRPSYSLKDVITSSDLICVGRVVRGHVEDNGGLVRITKVVKGQSKSEEIEISGVGLKDVPIYGDRLFLLHSVGDDRYVFTNSAARSLPAIPPYKVGPDFNDTIARIESNVVAANSVPSVDRYFALRVVTQLSSQNDLSELEAIATNDAIPPGLKLQAKADLIWWGRDKYTDDVLQALNQDAIQADPILKNNLAVVVRDRVRNHSHASLLSSLTYSRDDQVRRAAATALSSMASPDLLPVFARLLSDSDREVRYMAVAGIAKQRGPSVQIPSPMKFSADESQLIREAREFASKR